MAFPPYYSVLYHAADPLGGGGVPPLDYREVDAPVYTVSSAKAIICSLALNH
jgi:hypothetical protein